MRVSLGVMSVSESDSVRVGVRADVDEMSQKRSKRAYMREQSE